MSGTSIDGSILSGKQDKLFFGMEPENIQEYVNKIQEVKTTLAEIYDESPIGQFGMDIGQYQDYEKILETLTPAQSALMLSTQGLTNEQILNTLALKTNAETLEYCA